MPLSSQNHPCNLLSFRYFPFLRIPSGNMKLPSSYAWVDMKVVKNLIKLNYHPLRYEGKRCDLLISMSIISAISDHVYINNMIC